MSGENPIDKSLKILARKHPESFLKLILGESHDYFLKVIENPVLNVPEKRSDFIYILERGLERFALHMDFQLIPQKEFIKRMFLYNALFTDTLVIPVCSVAIYPEKGDYHTFPDEYKVEIKENLSNRFTFKAIKLWDYRKEIENGKFPGLIPLLILIEKKPDEKTLKKEKMLIDRINDRGLKLDLTAVAITVASRRFTREF